MLLQDHGSGQCGLQAVGGPEPDYPPECVQGLLVFFLVVREGIEELLHLIGGSMLADDLPLFGGEGLRLSRHFFGNLGDTMLSWARIKLGFREQDFLPRGQAAYHLDPILPGACTQAHITPGWSLLRFHDDEVELPHLCHCL